MTSWMAARTGMRRFLVMTGLLLVALFVAIPARARPATAWTDAPRLAVFRWNETAPSASLAVVPDPSVAVQLEDGQLLLVPVSDGDVVRIEGSGFIAGEGTGFGDVPDAISWLRTESETNRVEHRVRTWGTVQFVVVGPRRDRTQVRVWMAARRRDPMAWHRADAEVFRWLRSGGEMPPISEPLEDAHPVLEWLAAVRSLIAGDGDISSQECAYLQARWLEEVARLRSTTSPFFVPVPVSATGGTPEPSSESARGFSAPVARRVTIGEAVVLQSPAADVLSVMVRARAVGTTIVRILAGDAVVRELKITVPLRAQHPQRWTPARRLRVVPASGDLRVEVVQGTARIWAFGYSQRNALYRSRIRGRRSLLELAQKQGRDGPNPLLAALARAAQTRRLEAVAELTRLGRDPSLSAGLRALALHDVVRSSGAMDLQSGALTELWSLTRTLPAKLAIVLRRSAIQHFADAHSAPPEGLVLAPWEGQRPGGFGDELDSLEAARVLVTPPRDRRRSVVALRTEQRAADSPGRTVVERYAARVWRRAAPWRNLSPVRGEGTLMRFVEARPELEQERDCSLTGPTGVRWLRLDEQDRVQVSARGGSHTRVLLLGEPGRLQDDGVVAIDGTPLAVHSAIGVRTTVDLRPGTRIFTSKTRGSIIAKIPSSDRFPCDRLLDGIRWAIVRGAATFELPQGRSETVASIVVSPERLRGPTKLEVSAGEASYEAWVRPPATGSIEIPVPGEARLLTVASSRSVLVRVRVRAHRSPRPIVGTRAAAQEEAPVGTDELLSRVRSATRALRRATDDRERDRQRGARARALDALGYGRLAAIDRARISGTGRQVAASSSLPAYAVERPPGTPDVVSVGELPRIPPLQLPDDVQGLNRVLSAREWGEDVLVQLADLEPSARDSSAADALLLGLVAEEAARLDIASRAFERIGRAHASGVALGRAARLAADAAAMAMDPEATLRAYRIARDAADRDGSGVGTIARVSRVIAWQRVDPDEAVGSTLVESFRVEDEDAPLGARVRRALTDAPSFSVLSLGDPVETSVRRFETREVQVDLLCHALDGEREPCEARVRVEDSVVCRASTRAARTGSVAKRVECRFELPKGARTVIVEPPESEALVWVSVREVTPRGLRPPRIRGRWYESDAERELLVRVVGPGVVRLSLRGDETPAQAATVTVRAPDGSVAIQEVTPDSTIEDYAWRLPARQPVARTTRKYLTLDGEGTHEIRVRSSAGRLLARVEVAMATSSPPKRGAGESQAHGEAPSDLGGGIARPRHAPVGSDPRTGYLTLGATAGYQVEDLTEVDRYPIDDYFEVAVHLRHRTSFHPIWLRISPFGRFRRGPPSGGMQARITALPTGHLPGGFLFGRVVTQEGNRRLGTGLFGAAGLQYSVSVGRAWAIVPWTTVSVRRVDPSLRGLDGLDSAVYSNYAADRPRTFDLGVRGTHRPFMDTLAQYGVQARLGPELDWVDRLEGVVKGTALSGSGHFPRLDMTMILSHRPRGPERSEAFTRWSMEPSIFLWHWASDSSRITLRGVGSYFIDFPLGSDRPSEISGAIVGGYDFVARRGVRDFGPGEGFFSARLEEGHAPPGRIAPRSHPYWESLP